MRDWASLQRRFQRDEPAIQIGGLASNLSRIAWYAGRANRAGALPILRESKYFTEWAAPECSLEQQGMLADLQFALAVWERGWETRVSPAAIAQQAAAWSSKLLDSAGFLKKEGALLRRVGTHDVLRHG